MDEFLDVPATLHNFKPDVRGKEQIHAVMTFTQKKIAWNMKRVFALFFRDLLHFFQKNG